MSLHERRSRSFDRSQDVPDHRLAGLGRVGHEPRVRAPDEVTEVFAYGRLVRMRAELRIKGSDRALNSVVAHAHVQVERLAASCQPARPDASPDARLQLPEPWAIGRAGVAALLQRPIQPRVHIRLVGHASDCLDPACVGAGISRATDGGQPAPTPLVSISKRATGDRSLEARAKVLADPL